MNKFSIASAVVDFFPGPDVGNVVTGITERGVMEESSAYQKILSGSQFSTDQKAEEADTVTFEQEPIVINTRDLDADEMNSVVGDISEERYNESISDDDVSSSDSSNIDFDVGSSYEADIPVGTYPQSDEVGYDRPTFGYQTGSNGRDAVVYDAITIDDGIPDTDTRLPAAEQTKKNMDKVAAETYDALRVRQKQEDVIEENQRPFGTRLYRAFEHGNVGVPHSEIVGYDKEKKPIIKTTMVKEGGVRGALIQGAADTGQYVGQVPGKVLAGVGRAAVDVVKTPGRAVKSVGRGVARVGKTVEKGVLDVAAPAAAIGAMAFGATAGGAVAGVIGETRDILELPQREYHTPPGYQKVYDWARDGYRTEKVERAPIVPFAPQMGVSQVPGVRVKPEEMLAARESFGQSLYGGMTLKEAEEAFVGLVKKNSVGVSPRASVVSIPRGVSRTTNAAIKDRANLEALKASLGQTSPTYQRAEAALQSKVSGLQRVTRPGSFQDSVIKTSGLSSVV